ncbi:MAG: hypothetical protein JNL94_20015, partial [Planctomycetes bacterium]|nr:hypothetical protein [Planctomycetota bacterium]
MSEVEMKVAMESGSPAGIAVAKNLEAASRADKTAWPSRLAYLVAGWSLFIVAWHLVSRGIKISDIPSPLQTWNALAEVLEQGLLWKNVI